MRIEDIKNKQIAIASFSLASILSLISFFTLNSTLIILSFFFLLICVLSFNYGYIFFSLLSSFFGFGQKLTHYKLSKERNCIITEDPKRASFVIELIFKRESPNEIKKLLEVIDFPFKLELVLSKENAEKLIEDLKVKRAMLELKLQKEKDKEIISRKIAEIDEEINRISLANPLNAFFFAFVSAEGNSENEAIAKAYERAKSFCNAAQAILGASTRIICDEEINRAIDIAIFPSGLNEYKNL